MTRKRFAEQLQAAQKTVSGWDGCVSAGENGVCLPVELGRLFRRIWR